MGWAERWEVDVLLDFGAEVVLFEFKSEHDGQSRHLRGHDRTTPNAATDARDQRLIQMGLRFIV